MSQHDLIIDNANGATFRADVAAALKAIASCSSGATAPATTYPSMFWMDTSTGLFKRRNLANSAWEVIANIAETLTNKTIALGSNTLRGTLAQFNAACTDADFSSIADLNASGRVINVKHFSDGGGSTTAGSFVSAQASYFNYTPKSTNSTLIVIYTAYENQPVVGGTNYYHYYDVYETPGNSRVGSLASQTASGAGGVGQLSQIACSFQVSNTALTTRSFYMVHSSSSGTTVSLTAIHATIIEVLN